MSVKKSWKDWAIEHIERTKRCPGDMPSFGLPTDKVTLDEFNTMINSSGTHKYEGCHFLEEILGTGISSNELKEVHIGDDDKLKDKASILSRDVKEVSDSKKIMKLKENLNLYIDRIHFKKNGSLSVPTPLLNIRKYIDEFFQ